MTTNASPKDMRTWIEELEAAGELIRVDKPVDPLTEMGSLLYQSREKAVFFEKLPHGWRSLGQAPASDAPCCWYRRGGRMPDVGRPQCHRLQIKGPNKSGILLYPRHSWKNYVKYQARNEPMPVAIFIGHYPLYYAAAATTAAYGLDEFEIAGGYLGEAVRLVKCETVDLEVPADAEIVLEGHIPPHYREDEGPFSEFQDYYVTGTGKNPIVEYQYMTRRHDAIFKNLQNGSEMEGCVFHKVPMSAAIYRRLKDVGGGADLHNVMALPGIFGLVVQMTARTYGDAKNVLMAALSSPYQHPKIVMAVDSDVDIFNPAELLWALSTRVNPQTDVVIIPGTHNHAMDASLPELGAPGTPLWQRFGSKMLIDATIPPPADAGARASHTEICDAVRLYVGCESPLDRWKMSRHVRPLRSRRSPSRYHKADPRRRASSEHPDGFRSNIGPKVGMKPGTGQQVDGAAKKISDIALDAKKFHEIKLFRVVIDEEIDIARRPRLAPRGRAEQVKAGHGEAADVVSVPAQQSDGFVAGHT